MGLSSDESDDDCDFDDDSEDVSCASLCCVQWPVVSHSYFYYTSKPECAIPDDNNGLYMCMSVCVCVKGVDVTTVRM